ncbi:hypothetical protein BDV25DRAFT_11932 [Aspergillus avenaceus]|uniref:Mid2 domain-containing protein n=1 Tax=Aspergillus avenaceus TaxID=36643 RepID=A0A5N6TR79_ASPAV|nr:hypothetical protein BDV25DRAFT_11932 [Aspergillus avenaceus]
MNPQTLHYILFLLLNSATYTQGWSLTYQTNTSTPYITTSEQPQPCTKISQAKGHKFRFVPNDSPYSFYVWANDNCSGPYSGFTPPAVWEKVASTDLRSYLVGSLDLSATGTGTSATGGVSATGTVSATGASSVTDGDGGSGSGLSSGAIAGVVVGVVAGVLLLAGAFWLGRRHRRTDGSTQVPQQFGGSGYILPGTPIAGSEGHPAYGNNMKAYEHELPGYASGRHVFAELPGDSAVVEMSDSSRVRELEGDLKR